MSTEYVINTNAAAFEQDVIGASHERLVLVDFWAEWCGPCKSIAPVLDALAVELDGALLVAKVDTDVEQELAQTYGIRSLPTMLLFRGGEPVEQIIGAQPAGVIRAAIEKQLPRPATALVESARVLLGENDLDAAYARLEEARALDPEDYAVHALLAQLHVRRGDYAAAGRILESLPINVSTDDAFAPLHATLHLARQLPEDADRDALMQRPDDDVDAQYQLGVMDALAGDFDSSFERLFELLAKHRDWHDGALHKTILDLFKLLDEADPRLKTYRTRLARTLN